MASKLRTHRGSSADVGATATATPNTSLTYKLVSDVNKLHAVGFRNNSGSTVYLMIFNQATLPANGVAPFLPVQQVDTGTQCWVDFGASGAPMDNICAALSSTDDTLTTIAGNVRITVTFS